MLQRGRVCSFLFLFLTTSGLSLVAAAEPELRVVATSPRAYAPTPTSATIVWVFDRPINPLTVDAAHFPVFGRRSGPADGAYSIENGGLVVRFVPSQEFFVGEKVVSNVARVVAADGTRLRKAGYTHEFGVVASPSSASFELLDVYSVAGGDVPRIYGGSAADLDDDGWIDMAIVNQTTSDVRVLMNLADGSGEFGPYLTPPTAVGDFPSPNHTADFNRDGLIDLVTANKSSASSSVLLGNGDGTWQSAVTVPMGSNPSGLAAFDADGDGDWDIATANANGNHVNLAMNDGTGAFVPKPPFDSGGDREYGLAAADMNRDGIYDLLVGATNSQEIITMLGVGDGTFQSVASQDAGGGVYMLVPGDVNGDGRLDLSVANGFTGSGSILIGNGDGTLQPPVVFSMDDMHTTATDLGDVDGDGDLDWILSGFAAGFWRLFENDGQGNFTFSQQFDASANPACALIMDTDHDGDLDLGLLDEITDDITLLENVDVPDDTDGDGAADVEDCAIDDSKNWSVSPAVATLRLQQVAGMTVIDWTHPPAAGSAAPPYDVLRSENPADFVSESIANCVEAGDRVDTMAFDTTDPADLFAYLVVPRNACGANAGTDSTGASRSVRSCP